MKTVFYILNLVILSQTAIAIPNYENEMRKRVQRLNQYSELKRIAEQRDQLHQRKRSCEIENKANEIPFNCYKYLALLKKYQISLDQIIVFENEILQSCHVAVKQQLRPFSEAKTEEISSTKCRELVREKNAEILYIQQSNYK